MFAHPPHSLVEQHLNLSQFIVLSHCCPQAAFFKSHSFFTFSAHCVSAQSVYQLTAPIFAAYCRSIVEYCQQRSPSFRKWLSQKVVYLKASIVALAFAQVLTPLGGPGRAPRHRVIKCSTATCCASLLFSVWFRFLLLSNALARLAMDSMTRCVFRAITGVPLL